MFMEERMNKEFPLRTPGGMTYATRVERESGPAIKIKHGKHSEIISVNTIVRQVMASSEEEAEKIRFG